MPTAAGLAYREAGPPDGRVALLVHGYPESSYMWRHVLPVLAESGWRSVAPDLAGMGDSAPDPPGTWERHAGSIERFRAELGIERCVPVLHDWGGLIGLRWACEHPDAVNGLVISASGFFPDGKWHGLAKAMRTPGTGEELVAGITREGLAAMLGPVSAGIDDDAIGEYWKAFAEDTRRHGQLDFYRSTSAAGRRWGSRRRSRAASMKPVSPCHPGCGSVRTWTTRRSMLCSRRASSSRKVASSQRRLP
jgi:haloalkane dehalogenase